MVDLYTYIIQRIVHVMESSNISVDDLSSRVLINSSNLKRVLEGKRQPSLSLLERIFVALDLNIAIYKNH